jgi:hypothetical protein
MMSANQAIDPDRVVGSAEKGVTTMRLRNVLAGGAITAAVLGMGATPAFAHDCFNPTKVPTAGVNYELTGFNPDGTPILVPIGPGQGNGGFVAIAPFTFGPDQTMTLYTHTLGAGNNPAGVVGGPGSQKPSHACDGKGIDYIDACFGAG